MARAKDAIDKAADKAAEEKQVEFDTKKVAKSLEKIVQVKDDEKVAENDELAKNPIVLEAYVHLDGTASAEFASDIPPIEKKELANVLINELKKI